MDPGACCIQNVPNQMQLINCSRHNGISRSVCHLNRGAVVVLLHFKNSQQLKLHFSLFVDVGVDDEMDDQIDHVLSGSCSLLSLAEEVCGALMGSFETGYK